MLPFVGGQAMSIPEILRQVKIARHASEIEGITLLGGEPFAHATGAAALAKAARRLGLTVMVFSGYTLEEIEARHDPDADELLAHTDILVDGPYVRELPDTSRRWIGSANQRIHFLTDRYRADDPCWCKSNTLEIRLRGTDIMINGFPAHHASGLWKRI
jgi:anaerobic ribonucleoside-triphosphate reductase activating protein